MAISTCPHCQSHYFELEEISPRKGNYKMYLVQCSGCGAPAGVTDYYNSGVLLKNQEKALKAMDSRIKSIENLVAQIATVLNRMNR